MWTLRIATGLATIAVACIVVQGCAGSHPTDERLGSASQAYDTGVDLISPTNCKVSNGRLFACQIPTRTLVGQELETAVPLRTVFKTKKSGNCSTQFPLEVNVETAGEPLVRVLYMQAPQTVLKRRDGQPIARVTLSNTSRWTGIASFDQSCAISLDIVSNEPDVNSKSEAEVIITRLQQDLTAKTAVRDRYQDLTLYHRAYQFLDAVAESFRVELTTETIQSLRQGALGAVDTLATLSSTCDGSMNDADRAHLMLLMMSLPQLGSADSWRNADGSTKTLADLVGPEAQAVLATVERLAQRRQTDAGSDYDQAYRQAAADVVRAEAQLARARVQLASWLAQ